MLPNALTFVNVVQHLRNFGRFEMNKRDLSRQREEGILLQKNKLKTSHEQVLSVLQIPWEFSVCSLAANSERCSGNSF
jgi:hypothetical protein